MNRFLRSAFAVTVTLVLATPRTAPAAPPVVDDAPAMVTTAAAVDSLLARPRIGLALGGGGARGGAHIGVLKVLEELRIPVDYVAGTSMGSIVGALFAIGLSPAQIEAEMRAVDWDDLFSDTPRRQERTYRRKQDDTAWFLPIEWGLTGSGLVLAPGVIAGQKLSFAFPNPELYLCGHDGFDNLAYPYRPVATDLATGEMVVLSSGNLLKAVRASMSIPGVFPPVDWNGRQLVDGFLARNLPVDVVRAMGADIVIAVDVGALPDSTDVATLRTLGGIAEQTGRIQSRQNVDPQVAAAEFVIRPDMPGISTRDFQLTTATIPLGETAARGLKDILSTLSVDEAAYAHHIAAHRLPAPGAITVDAIEIDTGRAVSERAMRHQMHQGTDEHLDLPQLKKDLARIYDFGVYELVDFSLEKSPGDGTGTVMHVQGIRKFYEPHMVHFGLAYEGGETGRSAINARVRVNSLELNDRGGELRNDLQLGKSDVLASEYYQPLTWSRRSFAALRVSAGGRLRPWYYMERRWGEYLERDMHGEFDLGLRLGSVGELRAGVLYGHLKVEDRTGLSLAGFKGARGGWVGELGLDRMDAAVFPRHGFDGKIRLFKADPLFGSNLEYATCEGLLRTVTSRGSDSLLLLLYGASGLGTELPEFAMFTLGGIGRLSGYQSEMFRGEVAGLTSLTWYHGLGDSGSPYSTRWYVGAGVEAGNAWRYAEEAGLDDLRVCGFGFLGAQTIIGPLLVTYARAGDGNDALYVTLGQIHELLR